MESILNNTSGTCESLDNSTLSGENFLSKKISSIASSVLPVTLAFTGAIATSDIETPTWNIPSAKQVITQSGYSGITEELQNISERYEVVEFSHPATVTSIERNKAGDPVNAILDISIDGKSTIVKKPYQNFNFDLKPEMSLIVEGINKGGIKQLKFRKSIPLRLDEAQKTLLNKIITAFA